MITSSLEKHFNQFHQGPRFCSNKWLIDALTTVSTNRLQTGMRITVMCSEINHDIDIRNSRYWHRFHESTAGNYCPVTVSPSSWIPPMFSFSPSYNLLPPSSSYWLCSRPVIPVPCCPSGQTGHQSKIWWNTVGTFHFHCTTHHTLVNHSPA